MMGFRKKTCRLYDNTQAPPTATQPDPKNYRILRERGYGDALVMEVYYPDCTNYEGKKILVFDDWRKLAAMMGLDPHFTALHGPFARVEPTEKGWEYAKMLAEELGRVGR